MARTVGVVLAILALLAPASGCIVPAGKANSLAAQNRSLTERNDALAAQLESLKVHSKNIEDLLIRAEEDLALTEGNTAADRLRLEAYRSRPAGQTAMAQPQPGLAP
ncbi:MAG: hypothetical protein ACYC6Y_24890, partial [Thermoguttaceae bacterium]